MDENFSKDMTCEDINMKGEKDLSMLTTIHKFYIDLASFSDCSYEQPTEFSIEFCTRCVWHDVL